MAEVNYSSLYDSKHIDESLRKLMSLNINGQNWIVLPSTEVAPINLNSITIPGNYVVEYYTNGPAVDEFEISQTRPVTVIVNENAGLITQIYIAGNFTCFRNKPALVYTQWELPTGNTPIYRNEVAPDMTKINHSNLWLDISDLDFPVLKRYNGTIWVPVISNSYLTYEVYDVYNRRLDIFNYIQTSISKIYTTILDAENTNINTQSVFHSSAYNDAVIIVSNTDEYLLKSVDGSTWTDINNNVLTSGTYALGQHDDKIVAVIDNSVTNKIYHTADGSIWNTNDLPINNYWISVISNNGYIMIYGENGVIIRSSDFINWDVCDVPINTNTGILSANENTVVFLVPTSKNAFFSKDNGDTWSSITMPILDTGITIKSGVYGDGKFVLLLSNGHLRSTKDFKTWTSAIPNNTITFDSLVFHKQLFILVSNVMMQYSYDCTTWFHYPFTGPTSYFLTPSHDSLIVTSTMKDINNCNIFKIVDMSFRSSDHLNDNIIHIDAVERSSFNAKQNTSDMDTKAAKLIVDIDADADTKLNQSRTNLDNINATDTTNNTAITTHEASSQTPTVGDKTSWNSKATGSHTHLSDGKIEIPATKIVSGILDISRMPASALNRLVTVVGTTAMYALTTANVQNGDSIRVLSTITPQNVSLSALQSLCFGNGKFIAIPSVNTNGSILTSTNGISWDVEVISSNLVWKDIVFGNGLFIIVSTTNKILTSTNGSTWVERNLPASTYGDIIGYGNGLFVIIRKNSNTILTSPDGTTWTSRTISKSLNWTSVSYGDGHFIIASSNSTTFMISTNGTTWTEVAVTSRYYNTICIDNQVCFAAGANASGAATNVIIRSINGINWSDITLPVTAIWKSICFGNGLFVLIGTDSAGIKTVMLTSTDNGITWIERQISMNVIWSKVVFGDGSFVAIDSVSDKMGAFSKSIIFSTFYRVIDDTKLSNTNGYLSFNSTTAGLVDWKNVNERGDSISDYGIEDMYTEDYVDTQFPVLKSDISTNIDNVIIVTEDEIDVIDSDLNTHTIDGVKHITALERSAWNVKAAGTHGHNLDSIVEIVGENVVSGIIDIDRIPDEAVAKIVVYPYKSSLYSLTTANVQNGDVVKITNSPKSINTDASNLYDITYGNGLFVAIASGSIIITSPDGITWTQRTAPVSTTWFSITYGNGLFVSIASDSNIIATSPDGITWTQRALPVTATWRTIVYANSLFVSIGHASNIVITSPDGITWTQRALPVTANWRAITYGNGLFVAIANSSNIIATSPDGITWTQRTVPVSLPWYSIIYGNGLFVAFNQSSTVFITSPDGINWTQRTLPVGSNWIAVSYGNGLFVIAGYSSNIILTSPDGITWTQRTIPVTAQWRGIEYANGDFVLVGSDNTNIVIIPYNTTTFSLFKVVDDTKLSSEFGYVEFGTNLAAKLDWIGITNKPSTILGYLIDDMYNKIQVDTLKSSIISSIISETDVKFNAGSMIISDTLSAINTHSSTTLIHLTPAQITLWNSKAAGNHTHNLTGAALNATQVTTGVISIDQIPPEAKDKVVVLYSDTARFALTKAQVQTGDVVAVMGIDEAVVVDSGIYIVNGVSKPSWKAIAFGNGLFVVISDSNKIMTSYDGMTWRQGIAPISTTWLSITYGNGLFVVISSNSTNIMTSPDGITWTQRTAPVSANWQSITYGNGLFVVISSNSTNIMTSPDGITWTQRTAPVSKEWRAITYGNGLFVAIAYNNTNIFMTSPDGITWTQRTAPVTASWRSICYGNGLFVVTATNTTISMTSPDGITWTQRTLPISGYWISITYGNGLFVVLAYGSSIILTSLDGITWTQRTAPVSADWRGIAYGNGIFVFINSSSVSMSDIGIINVISHWYKVVNDLNLVNENGYLRFQPTSYANVDWGLIKRMPFNITGYGLTDSYTKNEIDTSINVEFSLIKNENYALISSKHNQYAAAITENAISDNHHCSELLTIDESMFKLKQTIYKITLPISLSWIGTVYGNGVFMATGSFAGTTYVRSTDGITWTQGTFPVSASWRTIACGNGLFVAPGYNTTKVLTSPDGITWTERVSPVSALWSYSAYGNGMFVVLSSSGTTYITSPDGITWTQRTLPITFSTANMIYANGLFVAIVTGTIILTSPDGITWTQRTAPASVSWKGLAYGNNMFIATSSASPYKTMISIDGITWTLGGDPPIGISSWVLCYCNGLFFTISPTPTLKYILTSPDGITWSMVYIPLGSSYRYGGVCKNNVIFIPNSGIAAIGIKTFSAEYPVPVYNFGECTANILKITYGNGLFVATGSNGNIMTSPDGITWSLSPCPEGIISSWKSICYSDGLFVIVGYGGKIMTSPNTTEWIERHPIVNEISDYVITYGGNTFVAIGLSSNVIITSTDGINWTQRTITNRAWKSICYGNGLFVAIVSGSDIIMTSPDGITWTERNTLISTGWGSICYGNGLFAAISNVNGSIITSPDGITWTQRTAPFITALVSIAYGNGLFVVLSIDTGICILTTKDFISWGSNTNDQTSVSFDSVVYGNGLFIISSSTHSNIRIVKYGEQIIYASLSEAITVTSQSLSDFTAEYAVTLTSLS